MAMIWIIGRKVTLQANGHEYMAEPFIAFETGDAAEAACDLVEKISGDRPMMTSVAIMTIGEPARKAPATRGGQ